MEWLVQGEGIEFIWLPLGLVVWLVWMAVDRWWSL